MKEKQESERPVIGFRCPTCKTPLQGTAGQYFQCPVCGTHGTAPQTGTAPGPLTRPKPTDLPGGES